MKATRLLFTILLTLGLASSCGVDQGKENKTEVLYQSDGIELVYFHLNSRCVTCKAVEAVASETVAEYYDGVVKYLAYNIEEPEGEHRGKELGISGQGLVLLANGKKTDLTGEGFMYARSDPDRLKELIKEEIDAVLK